MPHRFEMHFHTAQTSPCGSIPAAEGIAAYAKQGYAGVVVTDHYAAYQFEGRPGSWADKMERWLAGYRAARAAGEAAGVTVLLGMELRLGPGPNEYLVYGVTPEQLLAEPALYRLDPPGMRAAADRYGWFVAQAHPCRPGMTRCPPALLDGVEIYNGNKRHDSHNDEAEAFCRENGLIGLSGSDFHEWEDLARGGLALEEAVFSAAELLRLLRAGRFTVLRAP